MSFPSFSFFSVCVPVCLSVKQRSFINEFSFVFLSLSVCPRGGVLPYWGSAGMCRPKGPHFSAWAAPKDSTFSTWTAPKDPPFQKYTFVCSTFRPGLLQKTPLLKVYVSLLFLVPKPPQFSVRGRSETPPPIFSVWSRSLSPPPHFKTLSGTYIYKPLSYMSTPGFVKQRSF